MFQVITSFVQKQEKWLIDITLFFSHEQLFYSSLAAAQQPPHQASGALYELPVHTSHTSIVLAQSMALTPSHLHRFFSGFRSLHWVVQVHNQVLGVHQPFRNPAKMWEGGGCSSQRMGNACPSFLGIL